MMKKKMETTVLGLYRVFGLGNKGIQSPYSIVPIFQLRASQLMGALV